MSEAAAAVSPLNEISAAAAAGLSIREEPFLGYLNLRGQADEPAFLKAVSVAIGVDLPLEPNTTITGDTGLTVLWLAPDEWLLITAPDTQAYMEQGLEDGFGDLFAGVTDISSGFTMVEIGGRGARELIARGCSLDLHPREFGPGRCAQTLLAKATVLIHQTDATPTFRVVVRRSFADYLWRWLEDAAG